MAAAVDGDRAEIDGQDVEGRLGSPEDRASELGGVAVGTTGFHNLGEQSFSRRTLWPCCLPSGLHFQ